MEKEITLEVADIARAKESLDSVMAKELPVVIAWKLAKASKLILVEFEAYDKVRMELVRKYGEEVEGTGGQFQIENENMLAFQEEFDTLTSQEVTMTLPLISIDDLDGREFKPQDLAFIWFLFEEEHDESS